MHPQRKKTIFLTLFVLTASAIAGAAAFVWSGVYNVAASSQHTQPVYWLLERAMLQSVQLRARDIEPPPLTAPEMFEHGAACYRASCEQCHGGPGVAQHDIALGMQPVPGPLMDASTRWKSRELYWITRHGITMSGMPAWKFQLSEHDTWSLVAFIERLPQLSPLQYGAVMAQQPGRRCGTSEEHTPGDFQADPARGRNAMSQYACNGCHRIPGLTGPEVYVGPPLAGMARRLLIAGEIANTPDNMVRWLRAPQSVDPLTAMPDLRITERDARDMAAYLQTLL